MLTDALKEYVQIGSASAGEYMHDPGEAPRHHSHKRRRQTNEVRHAQDGIQFFIQVPLWSPFWGANHLVGKDPLSVFS